MIKGPIILDQILDVDVSDRAASTTGFKLVWLDDVGTFALSGSGKAAVVTITDDYEATNDDCVIFVDCTSKAITVTLPAATDGQFFYIIKIDSTANAVTVQGAVA